MRPAGRSITRPATERRNCSVSTISSASVTATTATTPLEPTRSTNSQPPTLIIRRYLPAARIFFLGDAMLGPSACRHVLVVNAFDVRDGDGDFAGEPSVRAFVIDLGGALGVLLHLLSQPGLILGGQVADLGIPQGPRFHHERIEPGIEFIVSGHCVL